MSEENVMVEKRDIPVNIEDIMHTAYLQYSLSVNVGRAIPDVRDGLKPCNRRILYAMRQLGLVKSRPHMKSARVVGEVIGKYHPHGDASVYDTLVRMAQDFSMRMKLVDGQGNFGSIDGDPPAAYRYTECRMERFTEELLADIEKNTVDMMPTFDEDTTEPEVLPTKFPNLLVNGSMGIGVGMATNIPPHNLGDASACVVVEPVPYQSRPYQVESDWSAASYWYEMVALAPNEDVEIVLPALYANSLQGDSHGAQVFEQLGVQTRFVDGGVVLTKKGCCVSHLEYDFLEMPDLAQTFVVTCCMLGVSFHFKGLQSLKIKETDRIVALQRELAKLGFNVESRNDCELLWDGSRCEDSIDVPVVIDTYEDHRMAMAFAPVALKRGEVLVNEPQVVSKSYPRYWVDLESVGFDICVIE